MASYSDPPWQSREPISLGSKLRWLGLRLPSCLRLPLLLAPQQGSLVGERVGWFHGKRAPPRLHEAKLRVPHVTGPPSEPPGFLSHASGPRLLLGSSAPGKSPSSSKLRPSSQLAASSHASREISMAVPRPSLFPFPSLCRISHAGVKLLQAPDLHPCHHHLFSPSTNSPRALEDLPGGCGHAWWEGV